MGLRLITALVGLTALIFVASAQDLASLHPCGVSSLRLAGMLLALERACLALLTLPLFLCSNNVSIV